MRINLTIIICASAAVVIAFCGMVTATIVRVTAIQAGLQECVEVWEYKTVQVWKKECNQNNKG